MQVKLDENQIIVAYEIDFGLEDGLEIDKNILPEGFCGEDREGKALFWPGKWEYKNGKIIETGAESPSEKHGPTPTLEQQIADLQMAVVELYEEVLGDG